MFVLILAVVVPEWEVYGHWWTELGQTHDRYCQSYPLGRLSGLLALR
jgi:hypothetical protein